jgi:AraC family transcriptional regulator, alkane utilization regulator
MELLHTFEQEDEVSELLRSVRVRSTVWCRSELTAPWAFAVHARTLATFHLVLRGACWLEVDGVEDDVRLAAGDLVVLPHGAAHAVRDDPSTPTSFLDDILAAAPPVEGVLHHGGGGEATEILCGALTLEGRHANPVLAALPPLVLLAGEGGRPSGPVAASVALLRAELASGGRGSEAMAARLADLLLTQALRAFLAGRDGISGLRDPVLAPAVHLLNEHPERAWTVTELADSVALSRSAFSERFRRVTGEAPIRYLSRVRLTRAAECLRTSDATLAQVAALCGYGSEFSFSKAFKRAFGVSPGRYRHVPDELARR